MVVAPDDRISVKEGDILLLLRDISWGDRFFSRLIIILFLLANLRLLSLSLFSIVLPFHILLVCSIRSPIARIIFFPLNLCHSNHPHSNSPLLLDSHDPRVKYDPAGLFCSLRSLAVGPQQLILTALLSILLPLPKFFNLSSSLVLSLLCAVFL